MNWPEAIYGMVALLVVAIIVAGWPLRRKP